MAAGGSLVEVPMVLTDCSMFSKQLEPPLQSPGVGSRATFQDASCRYESTAKPLPSHPLVGLFFVIWELQVQSHAVLVMGSMELGNELRNNTTNSGSNHSRPPSAISNLAYTQASRGTSSSSSDSIKRQRSSEGQNDDNDEQPPKKRKSQLYRAQNGPEKLRLACHFHIYDPVRYSARTSGPKYRACEGSRWSSLAHLKDHLVRQHFVEPHCPVCEINFPSQVQLKVHYDNERRHPRYEQPVEDISDAQWQSIERCVRLGNTSAQTKESTVKKWFEIWRILFPGSPSPDVPWHESSFNAKPSYHDKEQVEWTWWQSQPPSNEPNSETSTVIEDDTGYQNEEQIGIEVLDVLSPSSTSLTPSLGSNTASTVSTFSLDNWNHNNTTSEVDWLFDSNSIERLDVPNTMESLFCAYNSYITTDFWLDFLKTPLTKPVDSNIGGVVYDFPLSWRDMQTYPWLQNRHVKTSEHDIVCSRAETDETEMPFCSVPFGDFQPSTIQKMDLGPTPTSPILRNLVQQGEDSGYSSDHHTACEETTKHSLDQKESGLLNFTSPQLESEGHAEYNIDRWFQEPVDPFEVKKRAVVERLATEPDIAAFAIPLFESQWKLESLTLSPGVVSCATEGTPGQTSTPSSSQKSTGKRKAQVQWSGISQSDRISEEDEDEDEDEEEPQQKRPKVNKDPKDEPAKRKFGCPFHKRHPTIYCLSKDPNMDTKEQKKWSLCGGQGFPYLRHLM